MLSFEAMKKFCSTCGNQLELSQRFCSECGAVNPFFVPAFTLLSDQSQSLEKLRIEKERIEKEMQAKEDAQKEFERQEQLKKQAEAEERQKAELLERARLLREKMERERIAANLKKEILEVKEAAEQGKKETIDLLREVRKEVKQEILEIGEENKRLKHEVEILSKQKNESVTYVAPVAKIIETEEQPEPVAVETEEPQSSSNRPLKVVIGIVVLMIAFLVYFYFTNVSNQQTAFVTEPVKKEAEATPVEQVVDTILTGDVSSEPTDTTVSSPMEVSPASFTPANENTSAETPVEKPKAKAKINVTKVTADLNGKTISGCGVTIGSDAKLDNVSGLVLVNKSANYAKYKCTLKLVQGSDTYTSSSYLYYNDEGTLIKIDGSNCE